MNKFLYIFLLVAIPFIIEAQGKNKCIIKVTKSFVEFAKVKYENNKYKERLSIKDLASSFNYKFECTVDSGLNTIKYTSFCYSMIAETACLKSEYLCNLYIVFRPKFFFSEVITKRSKVDFFLENVNVKRMNILDLELFLKQRGYTIEKTDSSILLNLNNAHLVFSYNEKGELVYVNFNLLNTPEECLFSD